MHQAAQQSLASSCLSLCLCFCLVRERAVVLLAGHRHRRGRGRCGYRVRVRVRPALVQVQTRALRERRAGRLELAHVLSVLATLLASLLARLRTLPLVLGDRVRVLRLNIAQNMWNAKELNL